VRAAHARADGGFGGSGVTAAATLGVDVLLDEAGFVDCYPQSDQCRVCALDGPAQIHLSGVVEAEGLSVEGTWISIPDAYEPNSQSIQITASHMAQFAADQQLTLGRFRLCQAAP
jgi:hypothetical protein